MMTTCGGGVAVGLAVSVGVAEGVGLALGIAVGVAGMSVGGALVAVSARVAVRAGGGVAPARPQANVASASSAAGTHLAQHHSSR